MTHPDPARLKMASDLLREALAILDEQGLSIAAAHLDGVVHLVEASEGNRPLVGGGQDRLHLGDAGMGELHVPAR